MYVNYQHSFAGLFTSSEHMLFFIFARRRNSGGPRILLRRGCPKILLLHVGIILQKGGGGWSPRKSKDFAVSYAVTLRKVWTLSERGGLGAPSFQRSNSTWYFHRWIDVANGSNLCWKELYNNKYFNYNSFMQVSRVHIQTTPP